MIDKCAEDHFRWIGIMADRIICSKNRENEFPLLSLSFISDDQILIFFSKFSRPTFPITIESLSDSKLYGIIVSAIVFNNQTNLLSSSNIEYLHDFDSILDSLLNAGYIPQKPCDSNGLKEGILEQHINLCKSIEFLVVDKSLNTTILLTDLHYLPHSFFVLKSDVQIIHLEDAVSLWLSKFHCNPYFSDEIFDSSQIKSDKNFLIQLEISKFDKIAACLARIFPEKIDVDEILDGNNEDEIENNIKLTKNVLDEIHAFVIEKFPTDENLFLLFFSEIFYATRSGVNKFVQVDYSPYQPHQPSGNRSPRNPRSPRSPRFKNKKFSPKNSDENNSPLQGQKIVKNPPKIIRPKIESKSSRNSIGCRDRNSKKEGIKFDTRLFVCEFLEIEKKFHQLIEKFPQNEVYYRKIFDTFIQVYQKALEIESPNMPAILMMTDETLQRLFDGEEGLDKPFENELNRLFQKESIENESSFDNIKLNSSYISTDNIIIVDDFDASSENNNIKLKKNDSYDDKDIVHISDIESSSENNIYNKLLKKFGYSESESILVPEEEEDSSDDDDNDNDTSQKKKEVRFDKDKISKIGSFVCRLRQYGSTFSNNSFGNLNNFLAELENKNISNNIISKNNSNVEYADNEGENDDDDQNGQEIENEFVSKIKNSNVTINDDLFNLNMDQDSMNKDEGKIVQNVIENENYVEKLQNRNDDSNFNEINSYENGIVKNNSMDMNYDNLGEFNENSNVNDNDENKTFENDNASKCNENNENGNLIVKNENDNENKFNENETIEDDKINNFNENGSINFNNENETIEDCKINSFNENGDISVNNENDNVIKNNEDETIEDDKLSKFNENGDISVNNENDNVSQSNDSLKNDSIINYNDSNSKYDKSDDHIQTQNENSDTNQGETNDLDKNEPDDEEMSDEMILREAEKYEFHLKLKNLSENSHALTSDLSKEAITVPNYETIVNALRFNSLSNPKYEKLLDKIIETMKDFKDERIILLMTSKSKKFKGIYILNNDETMAEKFWGKGPNSVKNDDVSILYKYSNCEKSFDIISAKSFNQTTDGFSLIQNLENESW